MTAPADHSKWAIATQKQLAWLSCACPLSVSCCVLLPCSFSLTLNLPHSWRPGAASLLWVECALQSLSSDLVLRYGAGAAIVFKQGPYLQALTEVSTNAWGFTQQLIAA